MILYNIEELPDPLYRFWDKVLVSGTVPYSNIAVKSKINTALQKNDKGERKIITQFDYAMNEMIFHALCAYDNISVFTCIGMGKMDAYKYFQNNWSKDYMLIGLKNSSIEKQHMSKIFYQLFNNRCKFKHRSEVSQAIREQYIFIDKAENDALIDISLCIVLKRTLQTEFPKRDIGQREFTIYIPTSYEEKRTVSGLFFCDTSIEFIKLQNFDYFLIREMDKSREMFLTYQKWFFENIPKADQNSIMIFSSVVLYLLGHRNMNDLDLYVHDIGAEAFEIVCDYNKNQSYPFKIEHSIKNTDTWPSHWDTWLDTWARKSGAKYFEDVLCSSKYHFYFCGMKIVSIDCDIQRRLFRQRPRAFADLIALRKRYPVSITIPFIPESETKYVKAKDVLTDEKKKEMIDEGYIFDEEKKEWCLVQKINKINFLSTVQWALRERYRMDFTEDEIIRECGGDDFRFDKTNIKSDVKVHEKIHEKVLQKVQFQMSDLTIEEEPIKPVQEAVRRRFKIRKEAV